MAKNTAVSQPVVTVDPAVQKAIDRMNAQKEAVDRARAVAAARQAAEDRKKAEESARVKAAQDKARAEYLASPLTDKEKVAWAHLEKLANDGRTLLTDMTMRDLADYRVRAANTASPKKEQKES